MSNKSYLAAPYRNHLSATARILLNHQLLSKDETHLDYGCGRGGDVEKLRSLGYNSTGYDPYYFPGAAIAPADTVTMGYVLNVIQDVEERREALRHAWSLAKKRLIVSANVRGSSAQVDPGVITPIGTFAKTYTHIELKAYLESVLGFEAIKLAKDKFLISRSGRQFTPLPYEIVRTKIDVIGQSGWVAPFHTIIKGYCNDFKFEPGQGKPHDTGEWPGTKRHYRLICKYRWLPGKNGQPVRVIHIRGGKNSEHMQWAIAALQRRNRIAEMKFHCIEQCFLQEFVGFRKFDFLDTENIKIYP